MDGFWAALASTTSMTSAAVVAVVTVHVAFIGYLIGGGFVALRWPRTIWAHGLAVGWGLGSIGLGWPCPLTWLERRLRAEAGMAPLPSQGFIAHYCTGVLYPTRLSGWVEAAVFVVVGVSWALVIRSWLRFRRRRARAATSETG